MDGLGQLIFECYWVIYGRLLFVSFFFYINSVHSAELLSLRMRMDQARIVGRREGLTIININNLR